MANEIFGSELNVDFSGILQQAEAFDEKLKDIDHTAKQLGNTLRNALGNIDLGGLKSLKDNIERLGESKISLKVVGTEELGKMSSTLDTLISQVDVFSKQGVGIFDSKALYSDNNNVLEISSSLEKIEQKISKLKEAWKTIGTSEQLAASDEVFKGFVPPTHKNGTEYKPESKTYQNAMREHLEAQARIAIEEKAIITESLKWAKMTEDEKAAYIEKKLKEILRAEEQFAKGVKKEYADTVNEMVSLMKQTDQLNKKNTDGSITPQIKQLESRFAELNSKRVQLEQQYGEYVVDIAQKTNSKVLAIEANRILEKNKTERQVANAKLAEYERLVKEQTALEFKLIEMGDKFKKTDQSSGNRGLYMMQMQAEEDYYYKVTAKRNKLKDELSNMSSETADEVANIEKRDYANRIERQIRYNEESIRQAEAEAREKKRIALQEEKNKLEQAKKVQMGRDKWFTESPQQAMDFSKSTQSINEQIKAIEYLKKVRDSLTVSGAGGEEAYRQKIEEITTEINRQEESIKDLKGKHNELGQEQGKLLNTTDQLQRKLALLFSVSAIQGYIEKMVSVRKEFELQQKSLAILIQDKMKADEIYSQTVQLALKSPFRVQELVKFTKQLSAYQIEVDSLHETTKRLADISAGLGVDMERLILAFGQVRAAEVLRGTELRQFTEAGVPMLEELAKYFSTIEERTVSTSEVFEMISKRAVSFEDVRKVIENMTNEGGVFFQMQEKQSETLYGRISNLHDSIDLMLNDIGASNDNLFTGSIDVIRGFIDSWRTISDYIMGVIIALSLAKVKTIAFNAAIKKGGKEALWFGKQLGLAGKSLSVVTKSLDAGTLKVKGFAGTLKLGLVKAVATAQGALMALKAAISSFLPALIFTAIIEFIFWIGQADEKVRELTEAFSNIDKEASKGLHDSINLYKELAREISNATTSERDRVEALGELKRVFGEILPDHLLEIKYIQDKKGAWDEAITAMNNYYNSQVVNQKRAKVEETYGADIAKNVADLKLDFMDVLNISDVGDAIAEKFGNGTYELIRDGMGVAIEKATDAMRNGEIASDFNSFKERIEEELSKYSGINLSGLFTIMQAEAIGPLDEVEKEGMLKNMREIVSGVKEYNIAIKGAEGFPDETAQMKKNRKEVDLYKLKLDEIKESIKTLNDLYNELYKLQQNAPSGDATKEEKDSYNKLIEETKAKIENQTKSIGGVAIPVDIDVSKIASSTYAINEHLRLVERTALTTFANMTIAAGNTEFSTPQGALDALYANLNNIDGVVWELGDNSQYTGNILTETAEGNLVYWGDFNELLRTETNPLLIQMGETAQDAAEALDPTPIQQYTNSVINAALDSAGLAYNLMDDFRAKGKQGMSEFAANFHTTTENFINTYNWIQTQLAANPLKMPVVLESVGWTEEMYKNAKALIPQLIKLDKLFSPQEYKKRTGGAKKNRPKKSKSKKARKSDDPAENLYDFLGEAYDAFQDFNEEMSAEAANAKIAEIYGEEFEELAGKVSGLDLKLPKFKQDDEDPYLDALDKVYKKAAKKTQDKIDDEKRKVKRDQDVEDAKALNDETERYIDSLFEQYELYKELEKLGVSEKQAKALFGLDVASLEDINKELERLKQDGKLAGTRMAEVELEAQEKIAKEERSIQEERLKTYIEYANKAVNERSKIELEYLKKMAEIEEATLIRPEDSDDAKAYKNSIREAATKKALKEYQDGLKKLEWDEFQKSDTFIMMFEDLEFASEALMRNTLEQLENFRAEWADMPLEDVRAIIDKMNELKGGLMKLENPFKVVKKLKKELKGLKLSDLQTEATGFETEIKKNDETISQLETIRTLRAGGTDLLPEQLAFLKEIGLAQDAELKAIDAEIRKRKDANNTARQALEITLSQIKKFKDLKTNYEAQYALINTASDKAQELYDAFSELLKLFSDEDSIGFAFAEMGMSMVETVLQTLALQIQLKAARVDAEGFGLAMNKAMGVIGWIVMGVQVISQVLGAIFGAKDKKLQKDIDKLDEDVEKLSKALEKLEDALEKNYAFASLRSDMQKINGNIDQQIAKRRRQIELEKDKKKTDKDQIKDWEDEIEELQEKRAELRKEMIESLGGVDDYRSATREFVDAWVDAFNETGNGLQGLTDNFREFFKNIILEQAVMKGAGKIMEPLLEMINTSLGDYEIQGYEEQKIKALSEQKMKELDEFLNGLFGENGMWNEWIDDKGQSLSGLQEGIQGVTEETAQIIEAYLNSIRFYIAQDNQNLADLRNFFIGSEEDTNPMLSQLRIIAQQTTAINSLLESLTAPHPTQSGRGLKVII